MRVVGRRPWSRQWVVLAGALSVLAGSAALPKPETAGSEADERRGRVERGLLPAAVPAGSVGRGYPLSDRLRRYRVPGLSLAVVHNGKLDWAHGYGATERGGRKRVTPETRFQAGSISKVVAALGALRLVQQGRLGLDEDVNRKLASWKVPESPVARGEKVTLRRLLSHTAGLTVHGFTRYRADLPVPTLLETFHGFPPANNLPIRVALRPGSARQYSGGGYVVLEQLVSDVTGEPFAQYVGRTVLAPLGMGESTFEALTPWEVRRTAAGHLPDGRKLPGGFMTYGQRAAAGLWTTPTDLAKLILGLQAAYAGRPGAVLSPALTREMLSRQPHGWGLGLSLTGDGAGQRFLHGGSNEGFDSLLTGSIRGGEGLVIMANANLYEPDADLFGEIERAVATEYRWPGFPVAQQEYVELPERVVRPWQGRYRLAPGVVLDVDYRDRHLHCYAPGEGTSILYPRSETRFFPALPFLAEELTFTQASADSAGNADTDAFLTLKTRNGERRGQRISATPLRSLRPLDDPNPTLTEQLFQTFAAWTSGSEDLGRTTPGLRATYGRAAAHYVTAHLPGLRRLRLLEAEEVPANELQRLDAPVRRVHTYRAETRAGDSYLTVYFTPDHQIADYEHFRR